MLVLKYALMILGATLFSSAASLVIYDIYLSEQLRRLLGRGTAPEGLPGLTQINSRPSGPIRWGLAQRLFVAGILPLLLALSITVIPDGWAGVRISQIWGARPGTLYPGVHLITPLVDSVALYDTPEQVFTTVAAGTPKSTNEVLTVQAREGLNIGLAVSVRYRLDPRRLNSIHANLPQPIGEEVVAPTVATITASSPPITSPARFLPPGAKNFVPRPPKPSPTAWLPTESWCARSCCGT
jgi:hypothetical protein